ncbi:hypothetical protein ES705_25157 [subsurface metagenome]
MPYGYVLGHTLPALDNTTGTILVKLKLYPPAGNLEDLKAGSLNAAAYHIYGAGRYPRSLCPYLIKQAIVHLLCMGSQLPGIYDLRILLPGRFGDSDLHHSKEPTLQDNREIGLNILPGFKVTLELCLHSRLKGDERF